MDPLIKVIKETFSLIYCFINEVQEMGCIANSSLSCNFVPIVSDVDLTMAYTHSLYTLLKNIQEVIRELENSQLPKTSNVLHSANSKDGKNMSSMFSIQKSQYTDNTLLESDSERAKQNNPKGDICFFSQCQSELIENNAEHCGKSLNLSVEEKEERFYSSSYQDHLCPPGNATPFDSNALNKHDATSSVPTNETEARVEGQSCVMTELVVSSALSSTISSDGDKASDGWVSSQVNSVKRATTKKTFSVGANICKKCNCKMIGILKTQDATQPNPEDICTCPRKKLSGKLKGFTRKSYTCSVCNYQFRNWNNLSLHMKKLHIEGESNSTIEEFDIESRVKIMLPVYCCKTCSSASKNISSFKNHMCKPPNDEGSQISSRVLITNLRKVEQLKKFVCNTCGVEFRAMRRILYHLPRCFPGPYQCNSCSNVFVTLKDMNYHKKTDHGNEKCFTCNECGKSFLRKASLRKHSINRHESLESKKVMSYKCDLCPKKFIKKIFRTNHKLRMHGLEKKFLCQVCGKRFMSGNSLMIHIDIHRGEKKFVCQYCNKKFQRKEKLLYHERTHTGEKPFKCERCDKAFVAKARLNEHLQRHVADKRFECDQCEKSYASSWYLKKHVLKKHNLQISSHCVKVSLKKKIEKFEEKKNDKFDEEIYEENDNQEQAQHLPQVLTHNSAASMQIVSMHSSNVQIVPMNSPSVQIMSVPNQSRQMHHVVQVEQSITMQETVPVIIHPTATPVNLVSFSEPLQNHCLQPLDAQSPQPVIAQAVNLHSMRSSQLIYSPQQQNQLTYPNS